MKITKIKKIELDQEYLIDLLCNKCGESMSVNRGPAVKHVKYCTDSGSFLIISKEQSIEERGPDISSGLEEVTAYGSYDSHQYLSDMTSYTFSVCPKCLREFFDGFKIAPTETVGLL